MVNENFLVSFNWYCVNFWLILVSCVYFFGYLFVNILCFFLVNLYCSILFILDFFNIKFLSVILEDYNGENNSFLEDGGLGIGIDDVDLGDEYLIEFCDFFVIWF